MCMYISACLYLHMCIYLCVYTHKHTYTYIQTQEVKIFNANVERWELSCSSTTDHTTDRANSKVAKQVKWCSSLERVGSLLTQHLPQQRRFDLIRSGVSTQPIFCLQKRLPKQSLQSCITNTGTLRASFRHAITLTLPFIGSAALQYHTTVHIRLQHHVTHQHWQSYF